MNAPVLTFLGGRVGDGEPEASRALRDSIEAELGWTAAVPVHGERVRLD